MPKHPRINGSTRMGLSMLTLGILILPACSSVVDELHVGATKVNDIEPAILEAERMLATYASDARIEVNESRCWVEAAEVADRFEPLGVICGPVSFPGMDVPWVRADVSVEATASLGSGDSGSARLTTVSELRTSSSPVETYEYLRSDEVAINLDATATAASWGGAVLADGAALIGLDDALAVAERAFRLEVGAIDGPITVQDDSGCFAASSNGFTEGTASVACGPFLLLDTAPHSAWLTGTISVTRQDFWSARAVFNDDLSGPVSIAAGDYSDADGQAAPMVTIQVPDPLPQAPGFSTALDSVNIPMADPGELGRLVTAQWSEFVIGQHGLADRLGDGPEALIAADGESFVVLSADWTDAEGAADTQFTLEIDGIRSPVELLEMTSGYWVKSVPDGASVHLEVADTSLAQKMDLMSGQRTELGPVALYRDVARVEVNKIFEQTAPTGFLTGEVPRISTTVGQALLGIQAIPDVREAATPGRSWLTIYTTGTVEDYENGRYTALELSLDSYSLRLPDGGEVSASVFRDYEFNEFWDSFAHGVTFDVPETLTTAELIVSWRGDWSRAGSGRGTFVAEQQEVIPLNFGELPSTNDD